MKKVEQSTHDLTRVIHLDTDLFEANAPVGTIEMEGQVKYLRASADVGTIDAKAVTGDLVDVKLNGWGKIDLGQPKRIQGEVTDSGEVSYEGNNTAVEVFTSSEGSVVDRSVASPKKTASTRFIKLKVKNNSWKRINAYVIGPKPDGKKFSYGFPMRPGQVRDKDWTIGTKVYRKTALGTRKLLIEIKESDEGQTVNLYPKNQDQ